MVVQPKNMCSDKTLLRGEDVFAKRDADFEKPVKTPTTGDVVLGKEFLKKFAHFHPDNHSDTVVTEIEQDDVADFQFMHEKILVDDTAAIQDEFADRCMGIEALTNDLVTSTDHQLLETFTTGIDQLLEAHNISHSCVTLSQCDAEDQPLMYISPGFEKTTGQTKAKVLQRNCRFLNEGLHMSSAVRDRLRQVAKGADTEPCCCICFTNRTADGELFFNLLHMGHFMVGDRKFVMGVQCDVTDVVEECHAKNVSIVEAERVQNAREVFFEFGPMISQRAARYLFLQILSQN